MRVRLPLRLDPARLRFWGVVLPIHLAAFATLYFGTYRLLEYTYSHAGAAAAQKQLVQAVREMPFMMPATRAGRSPHLFSHLLAAHGPIGLRLYGPSGALIGPHDTHPDADEVERVMRVLTTAGHDSDTWVEKQNGRQWVRGAVRLTAGLGCMPCHRAGMTLGAATMKIDSTEDLAEIRNKLRPQVGLLLALWIVVVAVVAFVVQRTVRRSLKGLEADLAAAAAGRGHPGAAPEIPLDPATAELHKRLRDFLLRQREREAEVATRLAHADQLASLGQLAAGLAHEIKNPLAGIQGALEVLKDENKDASMSVLYDDMLAELKRVNGILQRLLESGRAAPVRLARADLAKLVTETVELLGPSLRRRKVELTAEIAGDVPEIPLDAAKIRQVLLNLVQNAGEAMTESGGHVKLRASAMPEGLGAILAVEDDGPGIPREDLDRLFEPFFTTKFTGTGLGLAISKAVVEQHGGRIEVDSGPGRGTTFFVFLPAAGAAGPDAAGDGA